MNLFKQTGFVVNNFDLSVTNTTFANDEHEDYYWI